AEAGALPVQQGLGTEFLNEPSQLPRRRGALVEIDHVDLHPSLLEETHRLLRVAALLRPEDLHVHPSGRAGGRGMSAPEVRRRVDLPPDLRTPIEPPAGI